MDAKIRLEIWSGALGIPVMQKHLDAAELTADDQAELEQLISTSGVQQLPEIPPAPSKVRDASQVKLMLDLAGKKQTVRVTMESLSAQLHQLVEFVKERGR